MSFRSLALLIVVLTAFEAAADEIAPGIFRTPDARFENLEGYPFEANYLQVGDYRIHYLDEGPRDGSERISTSIAF